MNHAETLLNVINKLMSEIKEKKEQIKKLEDKIEGYEYEKEEIKKVNKVINCECGGKYDSKHKSRHMQSKRHKNAQRAHI